MKKIALVAALAGFALALSTPAGAAPPQNTIYEVTIAIRDFEDGETVIGQDCARFAVAQVCFDDLESCGPLTLLEKKGRRQSWSAQIPMEDEDGTNIQVLLNGVTEPRGRGSAIAATAIANGVDDEGAKVRRNASIAGVAVLQCTVEPSE